MGLRVKLRVLLKGWTKFIALFLASQKRGGSESANDACIGS